MNKEHIEDLIEFGNYRPPFKIGQKVIDKSTNSVAKIIDKSISFDYYWFLDNCTMVHEFNLEPINEYEGNLI